MGGLLFIGLGIIVVAASGKLAEYNRVLRRHLVAHYQERVRQASGQTLSARLQLASAQFQLAMATASLEAGRADRFCFVLVGLATIGVGIFALLHPNGW